MEPRAVLPVLTLLLAACAAEPGAESGPWSGEWSLRIDWAAGEHDGEGPAQCGYEDLVEADGYYLARIQTTADGDDVMVLEDERVGDVYVYELAATEDLLEAQRAWRTEGIDGGHAYAMWGSEHLEFDRDGDRFAGTWTQAEAGDHPDYVFDCVSTYPTTGVRL